jgi:tetratricopeptide (TPR) repeat protein
MRSDVTINEFVEDLLSSNVETLTEEGKSRLLAEKQKIAPLLVDVFSNEIPFLEDGEDCNDPDRLYIALEIAALLQIPEAFEWIRKLFHVSEELLEDNFHLLFPTDTLSYLAAKTMPRWEELKVEIENPELDAYARSTCMDALIVGALLGKVDRKEVIAYFKSLFARIISGEINDYEFTTNLVLTCCEFWPGECIEEIKEVFGQNLVENSIFDISEVLEDLSQGKEHCLEAIQSRMKRNDFWEGAQEEEEDEFTEVELSKEVLEKAKEAAFIAEDLSSIKLQRNDECFCGSGQKYKKCCLNKKGSVQEKIKIDPSTIFYEPRELDQLPEEDREAIEEMGECVEEDPEKTVEYATAFLSKRDDVIQVYICLYYAYQLLARNVEAITLIRNMRNKFPNDPMPRLEYAHYLIRRGEWQEALSLLGNAEMLTDLYPDQKQFHIYDWIQFLSAVGTCYLRQNNLKKAKLYLDTLKGIAADSREAKNLSEKIERKARQEAFILQELSSME